MKQFYFLSFFIKTLHCKREEMSNVNVNLHRGAHDEQLMRATPLCVSVQAEITTLPLYLCRYAVHCGMALQLTLLLQVIMVTASQVYCITGVKT